ncbi:MAG: hypothetical protein R3F61_12970 [Myxococcota bacterium]
MRAWKMTAGLAVVALVAAVLAPRLFPQVAPVEAPLVVEPVVTVGEIAPVRSVPVPVVRQIPITPVPVLPAVPRVPEVPAIPARRDVTSTGIPELSTPIVPTPPDPKLDDVWMDMVDCGMG